MMQLHVEDGDAGWKRISDAGLRRSTSYTWQSRLKCSRGLRVLYISDPSGVLAHR
jgi:hypothetical protein